MSLLVFVAGIVVGLFYIGDLSMIEVAELVYATDEDFRGGEVVLLLLLSLAVGLVVPE